MISITARTELRSRWPQTAPSRLAGPQPWNHCFLAVENEGKVFRKLENLSVVDPALAGLHPQLLDRGPTRLMVRSPLGARGPPRNHPDTLGGDPALARLSRMSHFLAIHNHLLLTHFPPAFCLTPATSWATFINGQVT